MMVRRILKHAAIVLPCLIVIYYLALLYLRNQVTFHVPIRNTEQNLIESTTLLSRIGRSSSSSAAVKSTAKTTTSQVTLSPLLLQRLFHQHPKPLDSDPKLRMKSLEAFQMQMTIEERDASYDLLRVFDEITTRNGLPYVMYGGTLLGSYRHHDFVPWDDDIDLMVKETDRKQLSVLFKTLEPRYRLVRAGSHDKIYRSDGKKMSSYSWLWPYLDVSFYSENASHIEDIAWVYGGRTALPKDVIFPLRRRPFYNLSLSAPADSFGTLVWTYGYADGCKMFGYSHIVEGGGPYGRKSSCETLGDRYPFVHHLPMSNAEREQLRWNASIGVKEVLMVGPLHIRTEFVDEPSYALAETYVMKLQNDLKAPPHVPMPPIPK